MQATNALILARTSVELEPKPDDDKGMYDSLLRLPEKNPHLKLLRGRFAALSHDVYCTAVCERDVEPVSVLIRVAVVEDLPLGSPGRWRLPVLRRWPWRRPQ